MFPTEWASRLAQQFFPAPTGAQEALACFPVRLFLSRRGV